MPLNRRYADIQELAPLIPLFPLEGALLLPHATAPLNIFEPRYLAMIDWALRADRLIGVIQPLPNQENCAAPRLFESGCVGRITQFAETGDGRYHISLHGICRFKLVHEEATANPFRLARVNYAHFSADLLDPVEDRGIDRAALLTTLRRYAEKNGYDIDWEHVKLAPSAALVDALSLASPFGSREKQALLEAPTIVERAGLLTAIAEIELAGKTGGGLQ